ncbi:MAG: iron ABC transporter permease [Rothia sp. (in: high G+C Gram-positive bacteria)]|uniref:FecCD family ABC transporter permease n=1 Tax=Rothia sp. (in: high G+C Gram-positive bacteria) TaxID=1885016 RepID=UPI0026DFA971|nr:iron ABC transporter permease [Rothia sp. (in: high G+C Gram-positive bacteria)]MDO5751294.1 iron ABC transporter permease [Rothia sp. (in: high G+C Gram-positive bacteria)]
MQRAVFLPLLLLLLLFTLSLCVGSVPLTLAEVGQGLFGTTAEAAPGDEAVAQFIMWESRLPQSLTAVLAGSALALCGLVMQTLFRNPLADPSLLGVSGGASLGASLALLAWGGSLTWGSLALSGQLLTIGAAFLGAMLVILLLTLCSRWVSDSLGLLVIGVMMSFVLSAFISLLSFFATADGLRAFVVWGMGDFSSLSFERLPLFALCIVVPLVGLFGFARPLNALLLGEAYAANLGVRVQQVRTLLLLLIGLLTAVVTALCGPISFIGLAVPHLARLWLRRADHRHLLPATALLGADLSLFALILTHLPGARGTLPLAAVTPLLGAPVVLYLLLRRHRVG